MNEQIILTQNNYGVEIQTQFTTNKKVPINITNCSVEVTFVLPDNTSKHEYAYMVDAQLGICGFILEQDHTKNSGLHKTYWSVTDENGFITAQEEVYYYVKEAYGGNTVGV